MTTPILALLFSLLSSGTVRAYKTIDEQAAEVAEAQARVVQFHGFLKPSVNDFLRWPIGGEDTEVTVTFATGDLHFPKLTAVHRSWQLELFGEPSIPDDPNNKKYFLDHVERFLHNWGRTLAQTPMPADPVVTGNVDDDNFHIVVDFPFPHGFNAFDPALIGPKELREAVQIDYRLWAAGSANPDVTITVRCLAAPPRACAWEPPPPPNVIDAIGLTKPKVTKAKHKSRK